jgi:hypothetical protein
VVAGIVQARLRSSTREYIRMRLTRTACLAVPPLAAMPLPGYYHRTPAIRLSAFRIDLVSCPVPFLHDLPNS